MAENDLLKQLLDAGMSFTALTQARAEEVIRDLVRAGAVEAEKAQASVDELLERGRRNRERWLETVRSELDQTLANLNLATRDDMERMARDVADNVVTAVRQFLPDRGGPTRTAAPEPGSEAARAPAGQAPAKKTAARKTAAKRTAAKTSGGAKATARKTAAAKSAPAKKATAAKTSRGAKRPAAKKATARPTEISGGSVAAKKSATAKKATAKKTSAAKRSGSARKSTRGA
jgi:polyhydroxyalkanoate synthesis regulator phasin